MNRKILLIIGVITAVLIMALLLGIRYRSSPLPEKEGTSQPLSSLLAQIKELESKNDLFSLRDAYQKLVNEYPGSQDVMNWQKKIEEFNIRLLFSATVTPKSFLYEIKPADTLNKIAKEFRTTADLIKKSNNLTNDLIVPGRKIKVWNAPFSIFVDKSQNTLILKSGEEIIKTYVVSTGKNNSSPVGTFKITNKLMNPTWFKAGAVVPAESPENVLGTRWLGFDLAGYGIHGTTEPQNLGKQVTQGCVRLRNQDVEELYTIIPVGTEVTIVD
jgi:lipoprotein-anchoring transpeptidase ErfK/SrfK